MDSGFMMIVAAVLGFVTIAGLGFAFVGGGGNTKTMKRAHAITERTRGERTRSARATPSDPGQRRKQILKTLRDQERMQRKASFNLTARLQQAGLKTTVKTFWIISASLGVGVLLLMVVLGQKPLIALALAFVAGFGLPRWTVGFLCARRAKKFVAEFADASDIIVRGIKTGLPVHECLQIIGKETPDPLAFEFRLLVESVAHGMTMDQALEKMYERMPIQELRFFTIVLGIQQKTGGNLAEALSNLSAVLRARKLMREKIKALSSEATASAFIIGSLPPAVVTLISLTTPSYLSILFHEPKGQMLLGGGILWMGTGILLMRRMINFKF